MSDPYRTTLNWNRDKPPMCATSSFWLAGQGGSRYYTIKQSPAGGFIAKCEATWLGDTRTKEKTFLTLDEAIASCERGAYWSKLGD